MASGSTRAELVEGSMQGVLRASDLFESTRGVVAEVYNGSGRLEDQQW